MLLPYSSSKLLCCSEVDKFFSIFDGALIRLALIGGSTCWKHFIKTMYTVHYTDVGYQFSGIVMENNAVILLNSFQMSSIRLSSYNKTIDMVCK